MGGRKGWSLSARVMLYQVAIVALVVGIAGAILAGIFAQTLNDRYGQFSLGIARSVAALPEVRAAFHTPDPSATLQPLAESIRKASGVSFVVIANRDQIRYSHPNPANIGTKLSTDSSEPLSGTEYVATETGTLGTSVRGKVPIYDGDHQIIGVVSVGVLVSQEIGARSWLLIIAVVVGSLAFGVLGSTLLAARIKRDTLGLEPSEIASVYQERGAMLQAMREGVIAVDDHARITMANDEARRLLELNEASIGQPVTATLPSCRAPEVIRTGRSKFDEMLVVNGKILVANTVPMLLRGNIAGAVVTFRDHTEVDGLVRELAGVRQYAEALRAQSHEFSNKLHTISGMIELGWYDRVVPFIAQTSGVHQKRIEAATRDIHDPEVAAVLFGKASVAAERGITLTINPGSRLASSCGIAQELVTILGNLMQNAIEAVTDLPEEQRRVQVAITDDRNDTIKIQVKDHGPGVAAAVRARIFEAGFTTKSGSQRGIGLALVKSCVDRCRGIISIRNNRGAIFTVEIPIPLRDRKATVGE